MSEIIKIETPKTPARLRKAAAYLAPLAAVGGLMYGAVKYGEYATRLPEKPTAAQIKAVNSPSYPVPKSKEGKTFVITPWANDAEGIVEIAYPGVEVGSKRFIMLQHMVNKQLPETSPYAIDEGDQALEHDRFGSTGIAVRLTKDSSIPKENTVAGFDPNVYLQ